MAVTSGLIQRLKWVSGLRALFVYLGPTPEATSLRALLLEGPDAASLAAYRAMSITLAKARERQLPVSVVHDAGQVLIRSVDLRFSLIRVDGIEVTQAIQTLAHTIPLLAAKGTVARVYLSAWPGAPASVRGTLRITRPGAGATLAASDNQVTLAPADFGNTPLKRDDAARTLNFRLPADAVVAGAAELVLDHVEDAAGAGAYLAAPPNPTQAVTFAPTPPLRMTVIGFSYLAGTPPQTFTPTALDFDLLQSWLRRAYPVGDVQWAQRVVAANAAAPFSCGQINSQLAAIRTLDVAGAVDARTHYYGLVSDGTFFMRGCAGVPSTPTPGAVGSGPTGPNTWGWDNDGSYGDWYGGHEIGHTFGRLHPGFCGETADDLANYPFANGQLSNADGIFGGFDVGDPANGLPMRALPGVQWHDVMTYCVRQWVNSHTYLGIRNRLIAEDALAPGPGMGAGRPDERVPREAREAGQLDAAARRRIVHVVGRVDLAGGVGNIDYVLPLEGGAPSGTAPGRQKRITIRVVTASREVLESIPVEGIPVADEGHGHAERRMIGVTLAIPPAAAGLQLVLDDRVVDSFEADPDPEPAGEIHATARKEQLEIQWDDARRKSSRVTYDVLISDDGGRSWQTIGVGLKSPSVSVHGPDWPRGRPLIVRIRANGGFEVRQREFAVPAPNADAPP